MPEVNLKSWVCAGPKQLPPEKQVEAAAYALKVNPNNAAPTALIAEMLPVIMTGLIGPSDGAKAAEEFTQEILKPQRLAVLTNRFWGNAGVKLSVAFTEPTAAALQNKILEHANIWNKYCNVKFVLTSQLNSADLRISRGPGGYYSYLGTDNRMIPKGEQTMNLEGFVLGTPLAEYKRVVPHEFWHALGGPHEHQRREIIEGIDREKAIAWGARRLGWDRQTVIEQILTPLSERDLRATPRADRRSIMAYSLPGEIMKDGRDLPGGNDLSPEDVEQCKKIYPLPSTPQPPPNVDSDGDGVPDSEDPEPNNPNVPNPPNPPDGGNKVDRETLRGWFSKVGGVLSASSGWVALIPMISWVGAWMKDVGVLFTESSKDDEILDAWVNMISRVGLKLKTLKKTPDMKSLKVPKAEKVKALKAAKAA
jgi:hypothetical protein